MKDAQRFQQLKAARIRLQDPYAYMDEMEALSEESPLHRSENPYATLYMAENDDDAPLQLSLVETSTGRLPESPTKVFLSKDAFRKECTRIFEGYIPRHQLRRIGTHHRQFITRNEGRSGHIRSRLVAELKRYDLSDLSSLRSHFNRELPDDLSDKKLRDLEAKIVTEPSDS